MKEFTIGKNDAGQRLDRFVSKSVPLLPAALLQKYIRLKRIKCNGARAQRDQRLQEGDVLQLYINDEFFDKPREENAYLTVATPKLNIVYEDENIVLLNKRPGVLVHEDTAAAENTLIMHVKAYLAQKGEYDPESEQSFAPALCNRIDRNTGGIVIAAKTAEALRVMNEKIKNDEIRKFYLCAVHGKMPKRADTLTGYLKKNSADNTVDVIDTPRTGYKEIITKYRVLKSKGDAALLEVELVTGRTHQIRVHMAHIGHPVAGDDVYMTRQIDKELCGQCLHAKKIGFVHPKDGRYLEFESELPDYFKKFLNFFN